MIGIAIRALAVIGVTAFGLGIAGCDAAVRSESSTHSPEPTPHASPSVAQTAPAEALARIDLGLLASAFTLYVYDVPGVMPPMTSGAGFFSVNDTIFEQKVPEGTFSVWGADTEHSCIEYVTPDATIYALHPYATIETGPCPAEFRDLGPLASPSFSQPGTYRAFRVAPAPGPCFYESTAEFSGTGKGDAWMLVDCEGSEWTSKVVGGRFASEEEYNAGFDDAYGENLCGEGWNEAADDGAQQFFWWGPTEYGWSAGQRGVICTASWEKP